MGIETAIIGALGSFGFGAAASTAIAAGVVRIGGGLLLNAAVNAIFGPGSPSRRQPKAQDLSRELARPTALPAYRHVYGYTRATGTPLATPVKGEIIWGCWLLNSRPSKLTNPRVYFDKRRVRWDGDPFNMNSQGASANNSKFDGHVRIWISRGDQTSPPKRFLDDAGYTSGRQDLWKASDAWRGCTVIWLRLVCGENEERQERWPNAPPHVEVEGEWSNVWDPRDATQDPDDPETWGWSDNHALCALDALRQNPMRKYQGQNLHLESFRKGAEVCGESVSLKAGGTEKRYRAAGTLTYDTSELEDAVNPLMVSGAANFSRIGGRLCYVPGVYQEPETTLSTFVGTGFNSSDMLPGNELVNELRVSYLAPDRDFETAELQPWPIPGALAEDRGIPAPRDMELSFCPSPTQAMRVRKISGYRLRRQKRIESCELPPEAFDLVPGATTNLRLPAPYSALDGVYEIEEMRPGLDPSGKSGVALRIPARMIRTGPEIYAWSKDEEEDIVTQAYTAIRRGVQPPGPLSAEPNNLDTGDTIIPRLRVKFFPSASSGVEGYQLQTREHIDGQPDEDGWGARILISATTKDGDGRNYGNTEALASSKRYDIRVRTAAAGGVSSYQQLFNVPVSGLNVTINPPIAAEPFDVTSTEITVVYFTRNEPDTRSVEIWGNDTDDLASANLRSEPFAAGPNTTIRITEGDLAPGTTRYYWARTRGPYGTISGFTASTAATTTAT